MDGRPPNHDPPTRTLHDRLDSWKAIAAYVKRDVTTVQRWERREEMPVHRHLHDKQGSVYAFCSELDAWSAGRRVVAAQNDGELIRTSEPEVRPGTAPDPSPLRSSSPRRARICPLLRGSPPRGRMFPLLRGAPPRFSAAGRPTYLA
jgi:hypothetical protein